MTDPIPLPRSTVERCLQAARGAKNAAGRIDPKTVAQSLDQHYATKEFAALEAELVAALERPRADVMPGDGSLADVAGQALDFIKSVAALDARRSHRSVEAILYDLACLQGVANHSARVLQAALENRS